jgi:Flp pilus assembly protein TadG
MGGILGLLRGRRARKGERGAVAVEFAILLPVLLLILFGIVEFGFVFNRYTSVTHAAREGVRQLSVGATADDAIDKAQKSAPDLREAGNIECVVVTPPSPDEDDAQMTCSSKYDLKIWVFDKTVTVNSTATMRKEASA